MGREATAASYQPVICSKPWDDAAPQVSLRPGAFSVIGPATEVPVATAEHAPHLAERLSATPALNAAKSLGTDSKKINPFVYWATRAELLSGGGWMRRCRARRPHTGNDPSPSGGHGAPRPGR